MGRTMRRLSAVWWVLLVCVTASAVGCAQSPAAKKQKYLEKGAKYYTDGKYNEAVVELKNALQIDPKFVPALIVLGRAYRAKSWNADAARELGRAVELDPSSTEARVDLGQAFLNLESWNDAEAQA